MKPPCGAPNCNAYAERFVRWVKEECLNRVVPLGEPHLRRTVQEFATHYHQERNDQGLANELIERPAARTSGRYDSHAAATWWDSQLLLSGSRVTRSRVGQNDLRSTGLDDVVGRQFTGRD